MRPAPVERIHHGGAGTTTAAARSGTPQAVIAQHYDQHYWAGRVRQLGIGTAHSHVAPPTESLTSALPGALSPGPVSRARLFATETRGRAALDGVPPLAVHGGGRAASDGGRGRCLERRDPLIPAFPVASGTDLFR